MTSDDMRRWRKSMGFTQRAAAAELGIALPTYQAMERGTAWATGKPVEIDRRTALACAALRAGLAPEGGG
ncbi:MAG: helix-turn-helix transcriptional regulator [Rhodocyclaceae bacterium]|nr:helix-turn-helix transcriptional regulator [Rhodocyclaceae bacterium]